MTTESDVQLLEPGNLIELFDLDITPINPLAVAEHFHGYPQETSIWWKGVEYVPWPIKADGFLRTGDKPPNPTVTISNIDGSVTALCMQFDDLVGAILVRRRTFAKYLDAVNFPGGGGSPAVPPTYGPELISNNTFADLSGWTQQSGTVTSTGTTMRTMRAGGSLGRGRYTLAGLTVGAGYLLTFDRTLGPSATSGTVSVAISATSATGAVAADTGGTAAGVTLPFTATQTTHYVMMDSGAGVNGIYNDYDNVYVKQVIDPGSPAVPGDGNPNADPTQEFPNEIWYVERKSSEDSQVVKFELSSAMDFNGVKLPRRQIIANQCSWQYRSAECGYTGGAVADINDEPTSVLADDACAKKVRSCKFRFGETGVLNYGGFPAAGLMRT